MNSADLYQPVYSTRTGPAPLVVRAVVTPNQDYVAGGMPSTSQRVENYVLLSALPAELQERIRTAVQALMSGM